MSARRRTRERAPRRLRTRRSSGSRVTGDSSAFDPPIWHYGADKTAFYNVLGEDIQYAIWMRFTRGYLYPPDPFDKFVIAANTWHDASAYVPWPSKLEMLYKDQLILDRYHELLPYSEV